MNNSNTTISVKWFMELPLEERIAISNKYYPEYAEDNTDLEDEEITNIYLSEHPEQAILCHHCGAEKKVKSGLCSVCGKFPPMVKEESQDNSKEGVILGEENTVLAKWYLIPTSFKPIGELRDIIIAEMDIDVTNNIEAENTSLKARIVLLEDALKKNHQWALCLLADIEAGNVEYEEEYRLELNQDIAQATNLLK